MAAFTFLLFHGWNSAVKQSSLLPLMLSRVRALHLLLPSVEDGSVVLAPGRAVAVDPGVGRHHPVPHRQRAQSEGPAQEATALQPPAAHIPWPHPELCQRI